MNDKIPFPERSVMAVHRDSTDRHWYDRVNPMGDSKKEKLSGVHFPFHWVDPNELLTIVSVATLILHSCLSSSLYHRNLGGRGFQETTILKGVWAGLGSCCATLLLSFPGTSSGLLFLTKPHSINLFRYCLSLWVVSYGRSSFLSCGRWKKWLTHDTSKPCIAAIPSDSNWRVPLSVMYTRSIVSLCASHTDRGILGLRFIMSSGRLAWHGDARGKMRGGCQQEPDDS